MAEQVFRWGMTPGRAPSPQTVGAPATTPIPGGGGDGLSGGLLRLAGLGIDVYDRFWGPKAAERDLINDARVQNMQRTQMAMDEANRKNREENFKQLVEGITRQPLTPETAGAFPETRRLVTSAPGSVTETGPIGGTGPEGTPGMVARPYIINQQERAQASAQKEAQGLRAEGGRVLQVMPPGPARESLAEISKGPQILVPSQIPKTFEDISKAGQAATAEAKGTLELTKANSSAALMQKYLETNDKRFLYAAIAFEAGGPEKLAQLDINRQQAAVVHAEKIAEMLKILKAAYDQGDDQAIDRLLPVINSQQIGLAGLANDPAQNPDPYVEIYANARRPGIVYGHYNRDASVRVPRSVALKYNNGQMNPANPDDLLNMVAIEMGIRPNPDGSIDPDKAAAMKKYIASRGATIASAKEAIDYIDSITGGPATAVGSPSQQAGAEQQTLKELNDYSQQNYKMPFTELPPQLQEQARQNYEKQKVEGGPQAPAPAAPQPPSTGLRGVGEVGRAITPSIIDVPAEGIQAPAQQGIPGAPSLPGGPIRQPGQRPPGRILNLWRSPVATPGAGANIPPASSQTGGGVLDRVSDNILSAVRGEPGLEARKGATDPMIDRVAESMGLPANILKSMAYVESRYRTGATGDKEAKTGTSHGLFQFQLDTAKRYGITDKSELNDPARNIGVMGRHFGYLLRKFNGVIPLAVAAHRGGEGQIGGGTKWTARDRQYVKDVLGVDATDDVIADWYQEARIPYAGAPVGRR